MSIDIKKVPFLRYAILVLILWHIPGFTLIYINGTLSSLLSYLSYGLIMLYVVFNGKTGNCYEMLLLGLSYFCISILVSQDFMVDSYSFYVEAIKYFIIVWGGYEVLRNTTKEELWFFMVIGALSILGNIFLFNSPKADYGRYSGFYLDANNGGLICLMGFALSFTIYKRFRLFGKLMVTGLGLITFSRTFIVSWLLLNVLSIRLDVKNVKMLVFGFGVLVLLVTFNDFLPVKSPRLAQLSAFVSGEQQRATSGLNKDSRTDTWARYYDALMEKPIFGNGYRSFYGNGVISSPWGVHNTYLLIWGEGGILPLLIFLTFLIKLFYRGFRQLKQKPYAVMMLTGLALFLMTNHNFMTNNYSIFLLIWIAIQLKPSVSTFPSEKVISDNGSFGPETSQA